MIEYENFSEIKAGWQNYTLKNCSSNNFLYAKCD